MRKFPSFVQLVAFLIFNSALAASTIEVSITELHPTQPAAGFAASEFTRNARFAKAATQEEFDQILKTQKPFRAVRGPGGQVFLTDGHHRALGAFFQAKKLCGPRKELGKEAGCLARTHVRVTMEADYSDKTWGDFADFMLGSNNAYFPPEVRARIQEGKISKDSVFRADSKILPRHLGEITDSPLRSAMAALFAKEGLSGDDFANYIEFLLMERLNKPVVSVLAGHESDAKFLSELEGAIFSDPKLVAFLRCQARRDEKGWAKAQTAIENALKRLGKETTAAGRFTPDLCPQAAGR